MTLKYKRLINGILEKSNNKEDINEALKEWKVLDVFKTEFKSECCCGHKIYYQAKLINENNNILIVGSVCIKNVLKELNNLELITQIEEIKEKKKEVKLIIKSCYKSKYSFLVHIKSTSKNVAKLEKLEKMNINLFDNVAKYGYRLFTKIDFTNQKYLCVNVLDGKINLKRQLPKIDQKQAVIRPV